MPEFRDRLDEAMRIRGMTAAELARTSKVNEGAISQYRAGKYKASQRSLDKLARALQVSIPWLMGADVPMEESDSQRSTSLPTNVQPMPTMQQIPRIGMIACGDPLLAQQNIEGYDNVPEYVKCDFTLVCRGDSMINARIFDGDIVCIREQPDVENGEIAAVLIDSEEATLKRVKIFDDHIVLEPENPMYKPLVFWGEEMNNVRILGKATHFISALK